MIKRSLAATILAAGLVTVAHANLSTNPLPPQTGTAGPRFDPDRSYAENKAFASASLSEAATPSSSNKASPRTIALPGADAPNQGDAAPQTTSQSTTVTAPRPQRLSETKPPVPVQEPTSSPVPDATRHSAEPAQELAAAPSRPAGVSRPAGYRAAKWSGGEGATWKTRRDAYGFSGMFGGCRFRGSAGLHGYRLDRTC